MSSGASLIGGTTLLKFSPPFQIMKSLFGDALLERAQGDRAGLWVVLIYCAPASVPFPNPDPSNNLLVESKACYEAGIIITSVEILTGAICCREIFSIAICPCECNSFVQALMMIQIFMRHGVSRGEKSLRKCDISERERSFRRYICCQRKFECFSFV